MNREGGCMGPFNEKIFGVYHLSKFIDMDNKVCHECYEGDNSIVNRRKEYVHERPDGYHNPYINR